jgi:subfamily B ATP-binding cassette protein MsbA
MPLRELFAKFTRLLPFFHGVKAKAALVLACIVVSALTEPMIPGLMKPLLDKGFAQQGLQLWYVPVAVIGVFAVRSIASFLSSYGLSSISQRGLANMRQALFARLQGVAPSHFANSSSSQLTNIVVYEMQGGMGQLVSALLTLGRDGLTVLALLGYLFYLNWKLTLVVFTTFPVLAIIMAFFAKRLHNTVRATQQATDQLAYVVEENVLAWRAVRLHAAQDRQIGRFNALSESLRRLMVKATWNDAMTTPLTQIVSAIGLSAVISIALWQSHTAGSTVGSFVAFTTAMLMLIAPIKRLADVMGALTRGLTSVLRGLDLLEDVPQETGGQYTQFRALGNLSFEGTALHYAGAAQAALAGINLQIRSGETLALVGSSGAGKTTLVNLLPRFLEPTAGRISLDGVPLPDWDLRSLRAQFAFVSQDVVLFNDSIAANIAMGDTQDESRIAAALQAAHLQDYVASLPQGMHSSIGHNGSQLSGGQRQRLAIARALYKDAPILLLDEATSALDTQSEKAVQAALKVLMQGRTTLIIAHRLSTIEHADRILVMQHGHIVEEGTHSQLLQRGGVYARLQQQGDAIAS